MKKLPLLIVIVTGLIFIAVKHQSSKTPNNHRILEANLFAALALENKYITTCGTKAFDYKDSKVDAPLFEGLGNHTFPISTDIKKAQLFFNQGLNLTYGFNHTEAHRSFKEVAKLSGKTAMAFWGQAYALSPNINDYNLSEQRREEAYGAISSAISHIENTNQLEKSLINALNSRLIKKDDGSIELDNEAYMLQMEKVAKEFSDNADVQTLYAASIMNTMPWNYWERDMSPRKNTLKAKEALELAMSINPVHPGAHHYYIHLTELPFPDLAANSGDALAPLMPGAGHIVHMPSHAYIRVGRYKDAAEANLKAIKSDEDYISQCYAQGNYPIGYYPHNIHFLWSAATLMGDSKTAIAAAKKTSEKVSIGLLSDFAFMQEFAAIPLQAYVRFGKWNDILTVPYPGDNVKHLKLIWHYSRGIAFIRKGDTEEAKEELDSLEVISKDQSYDLIYASINNSGLLADIAYNVVAAELFAAGGDREKADSHFNKAIEVEDLLTYTEPPSWHRPVRLNYGAFLIANKDYNNAEMIYKEELQIFRSNGWSLMGLYQAYEGQGKGLEAKETKIKFEESWKYSDIKINSSVF